MRCGKLVDSVRTTKLIENRPYVEKTVEDVEGFFSSSVV